MTGYVTPAQLSKSGHPGHKIPKSKEAERTGQGCLRGFSIETHSQEENRAVEQGRAHTSLPSGYSDFTGGQSPYTFLMSYI